MKISIITFYVGGRDKYLKDCIVSVINDLLNTDNDLKLEHHIVLQGCLYPQFIFDVIANSSAVKNYDLYIHEWPKNIGIGAGLNKILPECKGDLIFKMDDDAEIISKDFFSRALFINKEFPTAIFSPQPLGLVNNMSGPPGHSRSVVYDKNINKYHTLRNVSHVGGFARFSPKSTFDNFKFPNDLIKGISGTEDGNLSQYALQNNIPMFYVETGMAVEHNESILGQQSRYPEYFKDREGDKETFKRWVK